MKWFGRAPALYLAGALAAVQLVAVLLHLNHDLQNGLSVLVTALFTILSALFTRPVDLTLVTGALATIGTTVGVFGLHVSADTISAVNAAIVTLATLLLTNLVS